jgi:hypothetical protein
VPAKITKLIGLKNNRILSPINLVIFAGTQNGQYVIYIEFNVSITDLRSSSGEKKISRL